MSEKRQVWALKYRNEEGCDDAFVTLYATRLDAYLGLFEVALDVCPFALTESAKSRKETELVDVLASGQEDDERHDEWVEWVEFFDHLQYWDVEPLDLPEVNA